MNTKTVYLFDPVTRRYTREAFAYYSPREQGVFIAPVDSTEIAPKAETPEGMAQVFDGSAWVFEAISPAAPEPEHASPEPDKPLVPQTISARQGRLILMAAGLLDDIEVVIASMPREIQLTWEYATEWARDWPLLTTMAAQFGLSDEQVDEMFALGATL